jgi:2-octaprenyl-6-methoxyphenol hydroxylase
MDRMTAKRRHTIEEKAQVAVIGGGLAGLCAALALGRRGIDTALVAPPPPRRDERTTALLDGSMRFLDTLGLGEEVAARGAPLRIMRLVDATGCIFHAPELSFHANEIGLPQFGFNIANADLAEILLPRIEALANVRHFAETAISIAVEAGGARIGLASGGSISCDLVLGADGRNSPVRAAAGCGERVWTYPQTAVVLDFFHTAPHDDASTEFHTPSGPFTVVPLGPRRCGLVWVETPQRADELMAMDIAELSLAVEQRMQSMLGKVTIEKAPQAWPLSGVTARRFGGAGWALAGEAAHVFPPIGAQGLNLGLRDVELLARLAAEAAPGAISGIGETYHRQRIADVTTRTAAVDVFNRSLLSSFLPVQGARAFALHMLGAIGPLRRAAMREGVAPGGFLGRVSQRLGAFQPGKKAAT